jgi:hypothetical protein
VVRRLSAPVAAYATVRSRASCLSDWERDAASAVCGQAKDFLTVSADSAAKLSREQKGRFVSLCWIAQIHKHFPDPKPSYVADWDDQPSWQRETNSDIFEAIEQQP